MKKIVYLFAILILLSSCKKELVYNCIVIERQPDGGKKTTSTFEKVFDSETDYTVWKNSIQNPNGVALSCQRVY